MNSLEPLARYLNDISKLANHATGSDKNAYVEPALKNLGSIAIPIIREVISPASFRNEDPEITDISVGGVRRIRAIANKFKYGERSRGLQILRHFGAGGRMAQNRTIVKGKVSEAFDLNTLVFGDSANKDKYVLPVKAGAQYSDAVSIQPYSACVDRTFHNRASEDGTLWNSENRENSNNLFERHFVRPGTLLLQVLTLNGRTLPVEALHHLLVSIGAAGAYGGQTSIYGVNVRNHVVGIFGGSFEQAVASPYEALRVADYGLSEVEKVDVGSILSRTAEVFAAAYPTVVSGDAVGADIKASIEAIESDDAALRSQYSQTAALIATYFDDWFAFERKPKKSDKTTVTDKGDE